jgi:cell division protein FtsI (penicillin-binding protein 3)
MLIFVLFILFARIFYLGIINRSFLLEQSAERSIRKVEIPAHRGMIKDRNGSPLAVSVPMSSIWINPKIFHASLNQQKQLAALLEVPIIDIRKKAEATNKGFLYLKRLVKPDVAAQINDLNIPGVFLQEEYTRYYPEAESTVHILGFTDIDERGQEGLELAYDEWLQGKPGIKRVLKDRLGNTIADLGTIRKADPGKDLTLSIDRRIQYLAYHELAETVEKYHAESGMAVVLSVKTGEILAMANLPSCNPNNRQELNPVCYRNRAVTDVFEPGSTVKAFSVANALESGKYTPNTWIDTNPGHIKVYNHVIYDDEHVNNGLLTVTGVLKRSSDVGVAKMTLSLPPYSLLNVLKRVGFGQSTDSGFPGEVTGSLPNNLRARPLVLATLAFGYAMSTDALQLASAYASIASGGMMRQVTFLKVDNPLSERRVLSQKIANEILAMLETVVEYGGTGRRAHVSGYHVAGKTGTAYIAGKHGYYQDRYFAIFAGMAPLENPEAVVAVVIKNPRGGAYYGGLVAAPVFSNIMAGTLRTLNVVPDDVARNKI